MGKLGSNLNTVSYFSAERPFLNGLKHADQWFVTGGSGSPNDMDVDSNGYPQSMTLLGGAGTATAFDAVCYFAQPGFIGNWVLLYDGSAGNTVSLTNLGAPSFTSTGRVIYNNTSPGNQINLHITAIDGADHIRNVRVVYSPDSTSGVVGVNEALLNGGEYFNPDFIARLRQIVSRNGTGCVRFMDWQKTNQSITQNWSDRTLISWWTWAHGPEDGLANSSKNVGVPVEVMCALSARLGVDNWFCMPVQASDDYISQFAALALANSGRSAFVEYANEYWSGVLSAANRAYQSSQSAIFFPSGGTNPPLDYATKRMVNVADLWKAVWPAARLVRVGSGQAGFVTGRNDISMALTTPVDGSGSLWTGTAASHWDAYAIAPYFGQQPPVAWTADADGGIGKLFTDLNSGSLLPNASSFHTTGGSSTAFTVTSGQSLPATPPNQAIICVKFHTATSAAGATLAADGGSAFPIFFIDQPVGTGSDGASFSTNQITNAVFTSAVSFPVSAVGAFAYPYASLSIASPAVIALQRHGLPTLSSFTFTTTGALPTGVSAGTTYYVSATGYSQNQFSFSASPTGTPLVNTSGTQSGIHTVRVAYSSGVWQGMSSVGSGAPGDLSIFSETQLQANYTLAHGTYGLRLVCYEGGQTYVSSGYGPVQGLITIANYSSSSMYASYVSAIRNIWRNNNNDLFVHFNDVGAPSNFGFWGAAIDLNFALGVATGQPKYDALMSPSGADVQLMGGRCS